MNLAIERCFADLKTHTIWIDPLESNKNAIRCYKRLGFEFVEKRRFGEDECAVYNLKRKLELFIEEPEPVFEILELLKEDPAHFVKKSVANHITDYLKVNPEAANSFITS